MSSLWGCPWGYPQGGRSHRGKGLSECFPSNGCDDLTGLEFGPSRYYVPARGGVVVCSVVRAGFAVAGRETAFSANLASSTNVSEGYTALSERGRLDLTVEAVIHDNQKWHRLSTQEDLAICARWAQGISLS